MDKETFSASYLAGFELDEHVFSQQFRPRRQYSLGIIVLSTAVPWRFAALSFCSYQEELLQSDLCKPLHLTPEEVQVFPWSVAETANYLAEKFSTDLPLGIDDDILHAHPIWATWKQQLWQELKGDMQTWKIFYPGIHIYRWQDTTLYLMGCYVCSSILKQRHAHMEHLLKQTDFFSSLGVTSVITVDMTMQETMDFWRQFHGSPMSDAAEIDYDQIEEACNLIDFGDAGDASNADDITFFADEIF